MIKVIDTKTKDSDYCQAYIRNHPEDRFLIVVGKKTDIQKYSRSRVRQKVAEMELPKYERQAEEFKIENLLTENVSMIIDHSNFEDVVFTEKLLEELKDRNYTLILDGQFLKDRQIKHLNDEDYRVLTEFFNLKIEDDMSTTWDKTMPSRAYGDIMRKSYAHNVYLKDWNSHDFICRFPLRIFPYFKDVLVLVKDFGKSETKRYLKENEIEYELLTDSRKKN